MPKQTITFSLASDKIAELNALAKTFGRLRTDLLEEAVTAYLETQQWQIKRIKAAVRQADEGLLIDHNHVKKIFAK